MQSYMTSQVGDKASQVGGIAYIVPHSYTVIIYLESNASKSNESKCKTVWPAK